jgi:hypothetical protein
MGLETALIASVALSAGSQVFSGIQQNKEAKKQAALAQEQANRQASDEEANAKRYRNRQVVAYLKSGVAVDSGSPLLAMQETLDTAATNAANIRATGATNASMLKRQGRNALVSGLISGAGSVAGGYSNYRQFQAQGYID